MKKNIAVLLLSCLFVSCTISEIDNIESDNKSMLPTEISIEEAIDNLNNALGSIRGNTKSGTSTWECKTVKHVEVVTMNDCFSLTKSVQEEFDKLIYIVTFEEGGSAVLGADSRLDPVLLITENSEITKSDLTAYPLIRNYTRQDLFCEEDQEYYIGNIEGETPHATFVMEYILNKVSAGSDDSSDYIYMFSASDFALPLLTTKWHQGDPYNGKIQRPLFGGERRPAGCTTIALVQMLVYNKDISISKFGISNSSWEDLDRTSIYRVITSDEEEQELMDRLVDDVSTLVKSAADGIGVTYNYLFSGGTFATPAKVLKYMRNLGYSSADKINKFSLPVITNTLEAGKPVFIAALSPSIVGHAWVIDGYVTQIIKNTRTGEEQKQLLLHCNWGWNGADDGYYIPELFDQPQFLDDPDNVTSGGNGFNSSWWYRIITY